MLEVYLGNDESGAEVSLPLSQLSHLFLLGESGTGKTVYLRNLLTDWMKEYSPKEIHFIIYDSKGIDYKSLRVSPYVHYPIYGDSDWRNFEKVLEALKEQSSQKGDIPTIVIIDDASMLSESIPSFGKKVSDLLKKPGNVHFFISAQVTNPELARIFEECHCKMVYSNYGSIQFTSGKEKPARLFQNDGALWGAYSYESPEDAETLNKHYEEKYLDLIPQAERKHQ